MHAKCCIRRTLRAEETELCTAVAGMDLETADEMLVEPEDTPIRRDKTLVKENDGETGPEMLPVGIRAVERLLDTLNPHEVDEKSSVYVVEIAKAHD